MVPAEGGTYKKGGWQDMRIRTSISLCMERSLLFLFSALAKKRRPRRKRNTVLVARTDGLGDYILWLSAEEKLRELYPGYSIEMMLDIRKPTQELVAHDKNIDRCFSVAIVTWKRFLTVFQMCRKEYDVIIQPNYSRLAFTDILIFAARAKERITIDTNGQFLTAWERKVSDRGYDRIIPCQKGIRHELIRDAELLRGLGAVHYRARLPDIDCLAIPKFQTPRDYIMVFPSASWSGKIWEKEKYAAVIKWLLKNYEGIIYLCGDAKDAKICDWIRSRTGYPRRLASLAGRVRLPKLAAYIRHAALVLGNDTGAIHLAAACRVKTVVITAEREIGRFLPYETEDTKEWIYYPHCIHQEGKACGGCLQQGFLYCRYNNNILELCACIQEIGVEPVIEAVAAKLKE